MEVILTEEELNEKCKEWQKILRLQDWNVDVRIKRSRDMDNSDAQGECYWVLRAKSAIIRIEDPLDYPPEAVSPQDMERTLVHELLHLHFAPFAADAGSPEQIAQEQSIAALCRALVNLRRQANVSQQKAGKMDVCE